MRPSPLQIIYFFQPFTLLVAPFYFCYLLMCAPLGLSILCIIIQYKAMEQQHLLKIIQVGLVALLRVFPVSGECPLTCYNGGECTYNSIDFQFYCECPTEKGEKTFTGTRCETPAVNCYNKCGEWQCLNDSKCGSGGEQVCECPPGFSGTFCEFGPTKCLYGSTVCRNGGTCRDIHASQISMCRCPEYTAGDSCQIVVDLSAYQFEIEGIAIGEFDICSSEIDAPLGSEANSPHLSTASATESFGLAMAFTLAAAMMQVAAI